MLHLVGGLHQPLHAANDHDAGGNRKRVVAAGLRPSNLHHFWDTEFVRRLGDDPKQVAAELTAAISGEQRQAWSRGMVSDWALESFAVARKNANGLLPEPSTRGVYVLDETGMSMPRSRMSGCNSAGLPFGSPWCAMRRSGAHHERSG